MIEDLIDGLPLIARAGRAPSPWPSGVWNIVVIGQSLSGKTTLVSAARESGLHRYGQITIPRRYITRPNRRSDNSWENTHVSHEAFEGLCDSGIISVRWKRPLGPNRIERYGFEGVDRRLVTVYSANTYVFSDENSSLYGLDQDSMLVVGVSAPLSHRANRLNCRDPGLLRDVEEVKARLHEPFVNVHDRSHVVISNGDDVLPSGAAHNFLELIRRVCVYNRTMHAVGY
jgi:hypothetical protein